MSAALQLYPYQVKGVEHLLSHPYGLPHALLADEPGTGKTVMAIEAAKQANCKTGVILCPKSIKTQWARQADAWGLADPDEIQIAEGLDYQLDNRPYLILNYALVREPEIRKQIFERKWHFLIEDEAQNLKGKDSQQSLAVFHKQYGIGNSCYYKWPLSGTIMPNRPVELYPLLYTHFPQVLYDCLSYQAYIRKFCGGDFKGGKGASNIPELTERLQKIMLLRALRDVWRECPPLIENIVWQDVAFDQHPEWVGYDFMPDTTIRRCTAEAKIPHVVQYVEDRLNSGIDKIVVFTFHKKVADGIQAGLAKYGAKKIYGGISSKLREASLASFESDSASRVLILQIMSAGEGLDGIQRVCAEYVLCEPEWSPGREDQAGRRILRIGQTRPVIETKLYAVKSYEEVIYRNNLAKRRVINVVCKPNGGIFHMSIEQSLEVIARVATKLEPVIDVLMGAVSQGIAQGQGGFSAPIQAGSLAPQAGPPTLGQNFLPPPAPPVSAPGIPASIPGPAAPIIPAGLPAPAAAPAAPAAIVSLPGAPAPAGNVLPFAQSAAVPPPAALPAAAPLPVPTAPAAPSVGAAPASPSSPTAFAGLFANRSAFEEYTKERVKSLGVPAGPQMIGTLCGKFGIERLGVLPEEQVNLFLQHLNAAIPA